MNRKLQTSFKGLLWFLEGIIVGFGAIMPGLSGGTLCVAFGMYLPLIWVGQVICIICGALVSYAFTRICASSKNDK